MKESGGAAKRWWLFSLLLILASAFFYQDIAHRAFATPGVDYPKHWDAAQALLGGENPYDSGEPYSFNYPLFVGFSFLHLALLPRKEAEVLWDAGNVMCILAGMLLLAFALKPEQPSGEDGAHPARAKVRRFLVDYWPPLVLLLAAEFRPLHVIVHSGNLDASIFFYSCLFAVLFWKGRAVASGFVLGLFTLNKLVPVFFVAPLVIMRRWKALAGFAAVIAAYALFLLLSGWWKVEADLYRDVLPGVGHYWIHISHSPHRMTAELLNPSVLETPSGYSHWALGWNVFYGFVYLGMAALWHWRGGRNQKAFFVFSYVMLLMFSPLLEINHFSWVLPAFFLTVLLWIRGEIRDGWFSAVMVAWSLIPVVKYYELLKPPIPHYWITAFLIYFLVGATAGAAVTARREEARIDGTPPVSAE